MKNFKKKDFPVSDVRRFIEPGPIVLVSSRLEGQDQHHDHGLAHGHGVLAVAIGCYIWDQNHCSRDDPQKQGMRDQHPDP